MKNFRVFIRGAIDQDRLDIYVRYLDEGRRYGNLTIENGNIVFNPAKEEPMLINEIKPFFSLTFGDELNKEFLSEFCRSALKFEGVEIEAETKTKGKYEELKEMSEWMKKMIGDKLNG